MSDASKAGPATADTIHEIQAHFPSDATLQDAIARLSEAGYDRGEFSLPQDQHSTPGAPKDSAENPTDDVDKAQLRTMGTGMAGYLGAAAVAGATVATGGAAAVAIAAAAAVGAGTALAANAAGQAADIAAVASRDERGRAGTLVLAVRAATADQAAEITALMQQSGATTIRPISRGADMLTAGHSSASWTGA